MKTKKKAERGIQGVVEKEGEKLGGGCTRP